VSSTIEQVKAVVMTQAEAKRAAGRKSLVSFLRAIKFSRTNADAPSQVDQDFAQPHPRAPQRGTAEDASCVRSAN
jgi:hypothetical protein